jgi:hypothetical protein
MHFKRIPQHTVFIAGLSAICHRQLVRKVSQLQRSTAGALTRARATDGQFDGS